MNMIDAVKSVLTQYIGFRGRARRSEFWFWVLAIFLFAIVVAIIEVMLGLSYEGDGPLTLVLRLATFLPGLAVAFRRLHDTGRSGWLVGAFYLALLIFVVLTFMSVQGTFTGESNPIYGILTALVLIGILIYGIVLIIFLCQDSVKGPNKYGPNPKNEGNYDVFE